MVLAAVDYISKNNVRVDIFYGKMSFQLLEEEMAYDGFSLLGMLYRQIATRSETLNGIVVMTSNPQKNIVAMVFINYSVQGGHVEFFVFYYSNAII